MGQQYLVEMLKIEVGFLLAAHLRGLKYHLIGGDQIHAYFDTEFTINVPAREVNANPR